MYIVLLASFIGYWAFLGRRYPHVYALFPFIILSIFLSVLYIAGLLGGLALGSVAILSAGLILLIYSAWRFCKSRNWRAGLKALTQPGIVLFFVFLVVGIVQLHDATFYGWDEFGNWGAYGKEMITTGAYIGPLGNDIGYYPPGLMLMHYFLSSYHGYSEGIVYFAQYISLVACLMVLLHKASWRSPLAWIAALLSSYFVVQGMEGGFVNIYQDTALSVFFAAAVISYFILRSSRLEFFLIPCLFALPILKHVGLFFALSVLALMLMDSLLLSLGASVTAGKGAASLNRMATSLFGQLRGVRPARIALVAALLVTPLASHEAWTFRLHVLDIKEGGYVTGLLTRNNLKKVFLTDVYEQRLDEATRNQQAENLKTIGTIRDRFYAALFHRPLNLPDPSRFFPSAAGIPVIAWYGIAAATFLYTALFGTGALVKARYAGLFLGLSLLLPVYIGVNIIVYTLALVPFSGLILDSYERVMAIFMGAFLLVGIACMILPFEDMPKRHLFPGAGALCALALATALLILQTPGPDRLLYPQAKLALRKSMEPMLRFVEQYVGLHQRVYIITQNSTGFAYWITRYELAPRPPSNVFGYAFGEKICARDIWTTDVSPAVWTKRLIEGKFDYVLIAQSDPQFWQRFRGLFQDGATDWSGYFLYKVEPEPGATVKLIPVAADEQKSVPKMTPDWEEFADSTSYGIDRLCKR